MTSFFGVISVSPMFILVYVGKEGLVFVYISALEAFDVLSDVL